jgi:hypothetical protein
MVIGSNVEYAGPWTDLPAVCEYLNVTADEVQRMVDQRRLLGCEFRDNKLYFPTRQFMNHGVVNGLSDVLDALAAGIDSPQVWATWMAALPEDGVSAWELLRTGRLQDVLVEARRDASRWSS